MLHLIQSTEGNVTNEGIEVCADILGISAAEVSGVATFYTMYKRRPMGEHHVGVCTNTLCAVMGGDLIFERLKGHLDVGNDETTEDGKVTLEHIECNAACDFAPVMMVNWEFFDNQTPESAVELVDKLRAGETVPGHARRHDHVVARGRARARGLRGRPRRRGPGRGRTVARRARDRRRTRLVAPTVEEAEEGRPRRRERRSRRPRPSAVEQADTSRAESETKVEESPADTAKEGNDD